MGKGAHTTGEIRLAYERLFFVPEKIKSSEYLKLKHCIERQ